MVSQVQVTEMLREVSATLVKSAGEIAALQGLVLALKQSIADLEAAAMNADPALVAAVEDVKAKAQAVDDGIPDAPVMPEEPPVVEEPQPEPETPVEPELPVEPPVVEEPAPEPEVPAEPPVVEAPAPAPEVPVDPAPPVVEGPAPEVSVEEPAKELPPNFPTFRSNDN